MKILDEVVVSLSSGKSLIIKNGLQVSYELRPNTFWMPRYSHNPVGSLYDFGGSNMLHSAVIDCIYDDGLVDCLTSTDLTYGTNSTFVSFVVPPHEFYKEEQWYKPGYFHILYDIMVGIVEPKCECGCEKVYGKNTRHASWCCLYTPNPWTGL